MNGHPIRHGLTAAVVYLALFLGIILVQFTRQSAFSVSLGSIAVSGNYAAGYAEAVSLPKDAKTVAGTVSLFFKGMEFRFAESDGLTIGTAAKQEVVRPLAIQEIAGGLRIYLSSGSSLTFNAQFIDGAEALTVKANFAAGQSELRVPYRPMRSARVVELDDGRSAIVNGEDSYVFAPSAIDADKRLLVFKSKAPQIAYGKAQPKKAYSPLDLVSPIASDDESYAQALAAWRQSAYTAWERSMTGNPDEEAVVAYVGESLARSNYRSAVATTPRSFIDSADRTYLSAPFFGRLDQGQKTLLAAEREALSRISRLANERNLDLFAEPDLVSFLSTRASKTLNDDIDAFARSVDPTTLTPIVAVGLMEAYADWRDGPAAENPYSHLVDQARFIVGGSLRKSPAGLVLPVSGDHADAAFTLRLGRAMEKSALTRNEKNWANLGRTISWSLLQLADQTGSMPADLAFPVDAEPSAAGASARISAARIYHSLASQNYLPRAIALSPETGAGLWAWTCAPAINAESTANTIDISVKFGIGETHYIMIRGIKAFAKIQLYGIDYRTDPRFERYDSSGWAYSTADRILMVKMKHKSEIEHIKIFY